MIITNGSFFRSNSVFFQSRRDFFFTYFWLFFSSFFNCKAYFFIGAITGEDLSQLKSADFEKRNLINILNGKMIKKKKILTMTHLHKQNKISWIYVFNSKKSYQEWKEIIRRHKMFQSKKISNTYKYFQKEGFLKIERNKISFLA